MLQRIRFSTRALLCAVTLLCTYLGLWTLTATLGASVVRQTVVERMDGDGTRLSYDPLRSSQSSPNTPWHFVGTGSSPCPFIVCIDWARMDAPMLGTGGRSYFFWFFGIELHLPIMDGIHWMS
ncbi:MAG: hypothetical protein KDB14_03880 [Planctomycetales bacterium]|nr:hypothetical protein [Planctomycetales bacterium]